MRILIVSQYFWPENFRINDLAVELSKRGNKVVVLTGWPNYPEGKVFQDFLNDTEYFATYQGVEVIRVPLIARRQGNIWLILNYISFAVSASIFGSWKVKGMKFDIVFVNQLSPVTVGLPAALIAKLKKVPMAMWVLDLWPDTLKALGVFRSSWLLFLVGRMVSYIYSKCDLILVQSRSFIPIIQKMTHQNQAIEYFPSWAEDLYRYDFAAPAQEVPICEDSFNVLFAGNVGESQDFPCILAAAEKLRKHKHIRWLIVGDGRMAAWVQNEIITRRLQDHVLMLGKYPVDRMPSFFMCADALLVTLADKPIFALTIPGKLQSYLTAGLPIVGALNGEGSNLLRSAGAGLISPAGDADQLAKSVLLLSIMPLYQRKSMGQNALALSQKEFSRKKTIDRVENMLANINSPSKGTQ